MASSLATQHLHSPFLLGFTHSCVFPLLLSWSIRSAAPFYCDIFRTLDFSGPVHSANTRLYPFIPPDSCLMDMSFEFPVTPAFRLLDPHCCCNRMSNVDFPLLSRSRFPPQSSPFSLFSDLPSAVFFLQPQISDIVIVPSSGF